MIPILSICETQLSCKLKFRELIAWVPLSWRAMHLRVWPILANIAQTQCRSRQIKKAEQLLHVTKYNICTSVQCWISLSCWVSMVMTISTCWMKAEREHSVLMSESFLCLSRRLRYANGLHTSPDGVCLCPWLHRWGQPQCEILCVCVCVCVCVKEGENGERKGTCRCSLDSVVLMIIKMSHDFTKVAR